MNENWPHMPAVVVLPVTPAAPLVLVLLAGRVLLGQKLGRPAVAACLAGIFAVVSLCLAGIMNGKT